MLSADEVKHIAGLARIGLEEEEIEMLRTNLSAVLDSFRELEQADVEGNSSSSSVSESSKPLREDVPVVPEKGEQDAIISLFPRKDGRSLAVKSVF